MADFCNQCAAELFGPDVKGDFKFDKPAPVGTGTPSSAKGAAWFMWITTETAVEVMDVCASTRRSSRRRC